MLHGKSGLEPIAVVTQENKSDGCVPYGRTRTHRPHPLDCMTPPNLLVPLGQHIIKEVAEVLVQGLSGHLQLFPHPQDGSLRNRGHVNNEGAPA